MRRSVFLFAVVAACARDRSGAKRVVEEERGDAASVVAKAPAHACVPACASGVPCIGGACPTPANARTIPHDDKGCRPGARLAFHCPPPIELVTIWGTDRYTDDSAICTAAVHAGLIDRGVGGDVAIEMRPGRPAFEGSTRASVTSLSYGPWACSYVFVGGKCNACDDACTDARSDEWNCGACGRRCDEGQWCHDGACASTPFSWSSNAQAFACVVGETHVVDCAAGGVTTAPVWGTDVYTNDSSICVAAVHAGKIGVSSGGKVTIEIVAGQSSYKGSARNGVTTMPYGVWSCSFRFK